MLGFGRIFSIVGKFCPYSPMCTVQVSRMLKGSQVGGCAPVLVTFNTFAEARHTFV